MRAPSICIFVFTLLLVFLEASFSKSNTISFHAVGDIVLGTNFRRNALPPDKGDMLFVHVKRYLRGADIVFGNFESTITNYPKSRKNTKRKLVFAFRTPPYYARSLRRAGFDILSIANNHSFDFFHRGFLDTAKNIEAVGVKTVGGKNEIKYIRKKGINIAFIAFGYSPQFNSIHNMGHAVSLLKKANKKAGIIIVSVHAGAEGSKALHVKNKTEIFYGEDRGNLVRFSHTMIRNGADLILGHGPHVPRALEIYRDRLIAYSLGNFVGYRVFSLSGAKGLSYILRAELGKNGRFSHGLILPLYLNASGIPMYDPRKRSIHLIRRLSRSDFPKNKINISSNGNIFIR